MYLKKIIHKMKEVNCELTEEEKDIKIFKNIFNQKENNYKSIENHLSGIYAISSKTELLYVGQAGWKKLRKADQGLRDRIMHHINKAHGIQKTGTKDTVGWKHYREADKNWSPNEFKIEFICINNERKEKKDLVEAVGIYFFQPKCNSQVFNNSYRSIKKTLKMKFD